MRARKMYRSVLAILLAYVKLRPQMWMEIVMLPVSQGLHLRGALALLLALPPASTLSAGAALAQTKITAGMVAHGPSQWPQYIATELGWLRRMGHATDFDGFWPGDDLEKLRGSWRDDLPGCWKSFLADAALSDPARTISYTNSKGETWRSTVGDILLHVVLHSAYHRGQAASKLKRFGVEQPATDVVF